MTWLGGSQFYYFTRESFLNVFIIFCISDVFGQSLGGYLLSFIKTFAGNITEDRFLTRGLKGTNINCKRILFVLFVVVKTWFRIFN